MFGIEPLARIVRNDARIEVKVPAAQGRKAYSYFREGGESEAKKPSGGGKKLALIGGGLALAGLGAAAIAMSRKKTETGGGVAPVSEQPKKIENNNIARNAAIGVGAAGLGAGAAAAKVAAAKKKAEKLKDAEKQEPKDKTESLEDIAKKPNTAHVQLLVKGSDAQKIKGGQPLTREEVEDLITKSSYFKVSDYEGEKEYSGQDVFKDGEVPDSTQETYVTILIPKNQDLLELSRKEGKPIKYSVRSRLSDSGGLIGGDPRPVKTLNGMDKFARA